MIETYSVLTRLPEPQRAEPALVAEFFDRNFPGKPRTLDADQARELPSRLNELGIIGGAAYDAVIALTASACGAHLISLDRRAEVTYRRCGIKFDLIGS
jgi:hypothetical protein